MLWLTLIRKLLRDTRWSLAFSVTAFFALALLTSWRISVNQPGILMLQERFASGMLAGPGPLDSTPQGDGEEEKSDAAEETAADAPAEPAAAPAEGGSSGPNAQEPEAEKPAEPQDEVEKGEGDEAKDGESKKEGGEEAKTERNRREPSDPFQKAVRDAARKTDDEQIRSAAGAVFLYRFLGGSKMDFSTLAMQVCWWNHPIIILVILGWAIARAAASIAGEIERGTLDLTLSRPVSRTAYMSAQVGVTVLVFVMLVGALIAGNLVAQLVFTLKDPPSPLDYVPPALMVIGLGLSVFGYTLPVSAWDIVRARPGIFALGVTLGGIVALSIAPQFEGWDWLENLSVFKCYAPVTAAVAWTEDRSFDIAVLFSVFAAGVGLSYIIFLRRDLPATGG